MATLAPMKMSVNGLDLEASKHEAARGHCFLMRGNHFR
jgi:hypothetical protein